MPFASESKHPWLNLVQYPFVTREFDTGDGWMSYADHGSGRPIVFVHGNPTWSYLFRHLVRDLGADHRCIAPDILGYGLSDKPRKVDVRPPRQAERFAAFMDYLDLKDVTLVVQCAGGPLALNWAMQNPDRVRDIVVFNSWLWPLEDNKGARWLSRLVGNPLNHFYYRWLNASPTFILPALFADRHRIMRPSRIQYLEPFRNYRERNAVYSSLAGMLKSRGFFEDLWERRTILRDKPFLFLWGLKDPIFTEECLHRFEEAFPNHHTLPFPNSGRYIPEEEPVRAIEEIRWFLRSHAPLEAL